MDCLEDTDDDERFLSHCDVQECCIWLLCKLRVFEHEKNPYMIPFSNYVLSWHKAVPLKCIIMAQSPYPDNVYPPIAAAMSYSSELAELCVKDRSKPHYKIPIPATVQIFANDMYINAQMKKEDTINILKNGWCLVEFGILLINKAVFTKDNDPNNFDESVDQCRIIIRLLKETEKYGKRTVDIYALGQAGQKMASDLCSWYKSSTVRLSKRSATHPAALARRFDNFDDENCHMNTPTFSKSLAKHFSNCVAFAHTMGKTSEADIKLQRYADLMRSSAGKITDHINGIDILADKARKMIESLDAGDKDVFRERVMDFSKSCELVSMKGKLLASVFSHAHSAGTSLAGGVSKSGPSLQHPSTQSLLNHTGKEANSAESASSQQFTLAKSKKKSIKAAEPDTETSSFVHISPPPSTVSAENTPTKSFTLAKSKSKARSANSTPAKDESASLASRPSTLSNVTDTLSDAPSEALSEQTEIEQPKVISSMSKRFRNLNITSASSQLENSGEKKKEAMVNDQYTLTSKQRDQLSSVWAVVESHVDDVNETDIQNELEVIQHDITQKRKYNSIVIRLVEAIDKDMEKNPKFDFANWAIDDSQESETYNVCKEIFGF